MKKGTKLAFWALILLLLALPALSACCEDEEEVTNIGDLLVTSITPDWDMLFEVPLDPQEIDIDSPSQILDAYMRAWQSGNGLIWAAVFQFADSADTQIAYNFAKADLSDAVQPEAIGDRGVSSTSTLGLKLYLFQRSEYLVMAGSAIMTNPDTLPPDTSLVQELAEEIDGRIENFVDSASSSGATLLKPDAPPAAPISQAQPRHVIYSVPAILGPYVTLPSQTATKTVPMVIPLIKEGEPNGTITFNIKVVLIRINENKCEYGIGVYIAKLEGITDDEDACSPGDIFVAGEITTFCGQKSFMTNEICDYDDDGPPVDFTDGGRGDGYPVCSFYCEKQCGETFGCAVNVLVRDSDTNSIWDIVRSLVDAASEIPLKYSVLVKKAFEEIDKFRTREDFKTDKDDTDDPVARAENITGDDIGRGSGYATEEAPSSFDSSEGWEIITWGD
jgi:hypothetical protein